MERPVNPLAVRPIRESEVVSPAEMIAVGDAVLIAVSNEFDSGKTEPWGSTDLSFGIRVPRDVTGWPEFRRRHGGRWNVVFCDGHVRTLRTRELFGYRTDESRRRWNNDHEPHREFPATTAHGRGDDPYNY